MQTSEYDLPERYAFLPEKELEEWAATLALQNEKPEVGTEEIKAFYATRSSEVESRFLERISQIERKQAALQDLLLKREEFRRRKAARESEIVAAEAELGMLISQRDASYIKIKSLRFRASQALLDQEEASVRERIFSLPQREAEAAYTYAKKLYQFETEIYEQNGDSVKRQVAQISSEIECLETENSRLRGWINELRSRGITRATSGFLNWAGYSAMPAMGLMLSYLLLARQHDLFDKGPLTRVWDLLLRAQDGNVPAKQFLLFFAFIVLGIPFSIWATDRFLRWFTRSGWAGDSRRSRRSSPDLPSFSIPIVQRRHFTNLVALIPFALVAFAVVTFLRSIRLADPSAKMGESVASSFAALYIGVAVMLLASGLCVLYSSIVIIPRLINPFPDMNPASGSISTDDSGKDERITRSISSPVRDFWEIPVSLLLGVISIVLSGVLPENSAHFTWAAFSAFVFSASIVLGCGVNLRGLYRDFDFHNDSRVGLGAKIVDLESPPSFNYSLDAFWKSLGERKTQDNSRLQQFLLDFQLLRSAHLLSSVLEPEGDDDSLYDRYWMALKSRSSKASDESVTSGPTQGESQEKPQLYPVDYSNSEELVRDVYLAEAEVTSCRRRMRELRSALDRENENLAECYHEIQSLDAEELVRLKEIQVAQWASERSLVSTSSVRTLASFHRSFQYARAARRLLRNRKGGIWFDLDPSSN